MKEEERINDEIKKFLQYTTKEAMEDEQPSNTNNITQLTLLLKELNRLYENHNYKESDSQILCDKIIHLIKSIISERKEKETEIVDNSRTIKKLEHQIVQMEDRHKKEQDEVKYKKMDINELERMIKDLNNKLKRYAAKNEDLRKSVDSIKAINEDLISVKENLARKNNNLEAQISLFETYLKEKDEENKKLKDGKIKDEDEIKKYKIEIKRLHNLTEELRSKIEEKNKSLSIINDELANLLNKDKMREADKKSMKERTEYYERLYKSVAKQNEYLNEQLSKMINVKNVDLLKNLHDEHKNDEFKNEDEFFDVMTNSNENLHSRLENLNLNEYRPYENKIKEDSNRQKEIYDNESSKLHLNDSKYKKYKKKLFHKKKENHKLRDEIETQNAKIKKMQTKLEILGLENEKSNANYKKLTNDLFDRIEELMKQNKEYQENIFRLKSEKISPVKTAKQKEYKKYTPQFADYINSNRDDSFKTVIGNVYDHKKYNEAEPNTKEYDFKRSNDNYTKPMFKYAVPEGENFAGHKKEDALGHYDLLPNEFPNYKKNKANISRDLSDDNLEYLNELKQMKDYVKSGDFQVLTNLKKENNEIITNEKFENIFEDTKSEPIKAVKDKEEDTSTTSSLKNMIKKTDKLKERFSDLEHQLEKIKGSDNKAAERIQEQIKAYDNFYLSDAYDYKNDPDAL